MNEEPSIPTWPCDFCGEPPSETRNVGWEFTRTRSICSDCKWKVYEAVLRGAPWVVDSSEGPYVLDSNFAEFRPPSSR